MDSQMENNAQNPKTVPMNFVTINWTNQSRDIVNQLRVLLNSGGIYKPDTNITCDGGTVPCNKILLSLCSRFFAEVFKDKNVESEIWILLPTISVNTFRYIYKYMLDGKVTIPTDQASSFFKTGNDLKVGGLIDMTTTVLIEQNTGTPTWDTYTEEGRISIDENSTPLEVPSASGIESGRKFQVISSHASLSTNVSVVNFNASNNKELLKSNTEGNQQECCFNPTPIGKHKFGVQQVKKESCGKNALIEKTLQDVSPAVESNQVPMRIMRTSTSIRNDNNSETEMAEDSDYKQSSFKNTERATTSQKLSARISAIKNRLKIRTWSQIVNKSKKNDGNNCLSRSSSGKRVVPKKLGGKIYFEGNYYTRKEAKKISIKCAECNKQLKLSCLKLHLLNTCKTKKTAKNTDKQECNFEDCQFSSRDPEEARDHNETHKDKYFCNVCQLMFTTKEKRDLHKLKCETSLASPGDIKVINSE